MSGTRPYSPGFGRRSLPLDGGSAMQGRPEPSDGKPRVPDAGGGRFNPSPNRSRRGKTRFRDDRSKKHHCRGANSGRYAVKKYDGSSNRSDRDPYGLRKDSPIKQYPNKKDKLKHPSAKLESAQVPERIPEPVSINSSFETDRDCILNVRIAMPPESVESDAGFNIHPIGIEDGAVSLRNDAFNVGKCKKIEEVARGGFHDLEMKMLDSLDGNSAGPMNEENITILNTVQPINENPERSEDVEPDVEGLYATLREYLQVEGKFQPMLYLPVKPQRGEIAAGTRDGAVHVLRCLKVWYDLPTDVLFHAINLLDRFLTKMKVRLCHISCISVSCMHIAILSHRPQLPPINTEDLVSISQCKCTAGDVRRMSVIIEQKLGAVGEAISPLHWLRLLMRLLRWAALSQLGVSPQFFNHLLQESEMINRLEILLCDASCCNIRACELALVLLCTQLDSHLTMMQHSSAQHPEHDNLLKIVGFAMELQRVCQIGDESFYSSHQAVVCVLERYNTRQKTPHRQCLVWRVSSRTLKVLRPTDKLTSTLPTIQEQQYSSSTSQQSINSRLRSGSESSDDLNEDTKDWPTSPVVPILCSNN